MRFQSIANWVLWVVVLGSFSSCVSVTKQAFEKKDGAPVKKIALLQIPEPQDYLIRNFGPTLPLGLIGGAIQSVDWNLKSDQFTQMVKEKKLSLGEQMARRIAESLRKQGYDVVYLSNQRPGVKDDKKVDFSQIQTDADAILDVQFAFVGYLSLTDSHDYVPWIRMIARLVSAKDESRLYFQTFNYGPKLKYSSDAIENIPSDPKYAYGSFDSMMANADAATEGIAQGITPIAARIAEQLR